MKKLFGAVCGFNMLSMLLFVPFFLWGEKAMPVVSYDGALFSLIGSRIVIVVLSAVFCIFWLDSKSIDINDIIKDKARLRSIPKWLIAFLVVTSVMNILFGFLKTDVSEAVFACAIVTIFNCVSLLAAYFCVTMYDELKNVIKVSPSGVILFLIGVVGFFGCAFLSDNFESDTLQWIIIACGMLFASVCFFIIGNVRMYIHTIQEVVEIEKPFGKSTRIGFEHITRVEKANPLVYTAYHYDEKLFKIPVFYLNSKKLLRFLDKS